MRLMSATACLDSLSFMLEVRQGPTSRLGEDFVRRQFADTTCKALLDKALELLNGLRPLLIPPDQIADIVAAVAVFAGLYLLFDPCLHRVRQGNIHRSHGGLLCSKR